MQRVVGDEPAPHQIPQRVHGLAGKSAAGALVNRGEERRAVAAQVVEDLARARPSERRRRAPESADAATWSVRYSAMRPSRSPSGSTPTQTTSPAAISVSSIARLVVGDARRQHFAFEHRRGNRRALQLFDGVEQRLESAAPRPDAVPRDDEAAERVGVDRFDFLAQPGERPAAQAAQDVGVDPLALGAAGPELALDEPPGLAQPQQQRLGDRGAEAVARGQLARR